MKRRYRIGCLKFVCLMLLSSSCCLVFAQNNWTGQAQCQLSIQNNGYAYQEIQTWAIAGTPTQNGAISVYPANWTASGQGGLQQQQAGQAVTARWSTNVPAMNAPLAIFIRASDQRLIIKSYHAALVAPGGINGIKQVGTVQSSLLSVASEWIFPAIEDVGTSTNVSGAGTIVVSGSLIPMQSAATSAIANCTWQFSKGTAASATPATRMLATDPQAVSAIGSSLPAGSTQSNNSVLRQSGPAAIAANAPANVQTMMAQGGTPTPQSGTGNTGQGSGGLGTATSQANPGLPVHAFYSALGTNNRFSTTTETKAASLTLPAGMYAVIVTAKAGSQGGVDPAQTDMMCTLYASYPQGRVSIGSSSAELNNPPLTIIAAPSSDITGVELDCTANQSGISAITTILAIQVGSVATAYN